MAQFFREKSARLQLWLMFCSLTRFVCRKVTKKTKLSESDITRFWTEWPNKKINAAVIYRSFIRI